MPHQDRDPKYGQARLEVTDGARVLGRPGYGRSGLALPRMQAGHVTVGQASGGVRDRGPLVPGGSRVATRRGSAAVVHAVPADGLTGPDLR